jgi:hypothetical protein
MPEKVLEGEIAYIRGIEVEIRTNTRSEKAHPNE